MTIVSGTTPDRRNRIIIFLALFGLFAGWFGYDGFVRYPAKNMAWARQYLASIENFPPLDQIKANPKATLEHLNKVKPGMTTAEIKTLLGEPAFQDSKNCCYIGVASFGWFTLNGDKIAEVKKVQMNSEPTESDIANQKRISFIAGGAALLALIHLLRVLKSRTVLDDQGLQVSGKLVGWDAMRSLDASQYAQKGWLDLEYALGDTTAIVRLDSYHIDLFDEIVTEICQRKEFASPLSASMSDTPADR